MKDPEKQELYTHGQDKGSILITDDDKEMKKTPPPGKGLVNQATITDDVTKQGIKNIIDNSEVLDDVVNRIELVNIVEKFLNKKKMQRR